MGKKETIVQNPFKIQPNNLVVLKSEKIEFEKNDDKRGMEIEE